MPFWLLADDEGVNALAGQMSSDRCRRGDRVSAQSNAANRLDPFNILYGFIEQLADQKTAFRVQRGLLAIEIKITLTTGSQGYQAFFV